MLRRVGAPLGIVAALMLPAGCASTGSEGGQSVGQWIAGEDETKLSPAEARLREDNKIFNKTVLGGVATGAATGAAIGLIAGLATGDLRRAAIGAGIGAGVGGLVGGIDGYRVAKRQEAARAQVREIELIIDEVEVENQRIQQSLDNMDVVIADTERSLRGARQGYRSEVVSLDEMRQREERAARNISQMDELIGGMEERNDQFAAVAEELRNEGEDTAELEREIEETQILLAEKKRERDLLEEELVQGRIG